MIGICRVASVASWEQQSCLWGVWMVYGAFFEKCPNYWDSILASARPFAFLQFCDMFSHTLRFLGRQLRCALVLTRGGAQHNDIFSILYHIVLSCKVCESATISQRSINDNNQQFRRWSRSLLSGVVILRKMYNFGQLYIFAVELFITVPVVKLFKFFSIAVCTWFFAIFTACEVSCRC